MKLPSSSRRAFLFVLNSMMLLASLGLSCRCVADEDTEEAAPEFVE